MLKLEEVYLKTVKRIRVESGDNKEISQNLEDSFGKGSLPIYPNCRQLKINASAVPRRIKIELSTNVSFHMNIVKKNMALAKRRQHSYSYKGPFLGLNFPETKTIGLTLKQSHYSDQDEEANCINYPNKKFNSFQDCDEEFVIEEMQKIGVMPFWATKGKNNVTSSK